jgi:hypothetical protein
MWPVTRKMTMTANLPAACLADRGRDDWRLPQLHHALAIRRRHLHPAPLDPRRAGAHLLRPAQHRHRPGYVKPGCAMTKQIPPAAPASGGHRMPSGHGTRAWVMHEICCRPGPISTAGEANDADDGSLRHRCCQG